MEALEIKQIFFTNLLLLEFDPALMEKKHRVSFSKEMFVLPNKKALHEVIYFLFDKLDHKKCVTEFRDCWPLLDKKQEHQFKKCVTNWLSQITQSDVSSHLPRLVPLFTSSSGDKIYQYMFALSRYVLRTSLVSRLDKKCYRDFIGHPCSAANPQVVSKLQAMSITNVRSRYLARTKKMVEAHEMWSCTADMFVKSYRESVKSVKDLKMKAAEDCEHSLGSESSAASPDVFTESLATNEICEFEMAERVERVYEMSNQLENFMEKILKKKDIFDSFLDGDVGKYKLDGAKINVIIPDQLLQECEEEIVNNRLHNLQTDGKLNLVSLIKLWNIAMRMCRDSFKEAGIPNMKEANSKISHMVRLAKSYLKDFTELKSMSEELSPEITKSVEELSGKVRNKYLSDKSPESIKVTSLGLGLVSPLKIPKTSDVGQRPRMPVDQSGPVRKSLLSTGVRGTSPEIENRIRKQIEDRLNEKMKKVPATSVSLIVHDDDDDICGGDSHLEVTGLNFDPLGNLNSTTFGSALDDCYLQGDFKRRQDIEVKSSVTHPRSSVKPQLGRSFSSVNTSRSLQKPASVQKIAKTRIPSVKTNLTSSSKKPADRHLDLLAEQIAERFVQSSGETSYEYLDDIMENPFQQIEQSAFETTKQLLRTPPSDGVKSKSNYIQEEEEGKDHPACSSRHHSDERVLEITDFKKDNSDADNDIHSFSLLTRHHELSSSHGKQPVSNEDFKLPLNTKSMDVENLKTAKHLVTSHEGTPSFSDMENKSYFINQEYETKDSSCDLQLRRMTACLKELVQSETPKLPERSKIEKVDLTNFDLSRDEPRIMWNNSDDFFLGSSSINTEERSKETVGQPPVDCLIDFNLSDSLTPCASPSKNLLPSSGSFLMDFDTSKTSSTACSVPARLGSRDNFRQNESLGPVAGANVEDVMTDFESENLKCLNSSGEILDNNFLEKYLTNEKEMTTSNPPSCERRTSRRFPYRPDLIFDDPAFDDPIFDLSKVEENPSESQKEESSFGLENSLIDLEGFDDDNLLSPSFLIPTTNKL